MSLNAQSYALVESLLKKALTRYVANGSVSAITDIHLQWMRHSGELKVLNDDDEVLSSAVITEWIDESRGDSDEAIERNLREVLGTLKESGSFDNLCLLKPYSFVLIDEDKETIAELLLVDDQETLFLHDGLLKGLDDELDAFLKELLEN